MLSIYVLAPQHLVEQVGGEKTCKEELQSKEER